MSWQAWLAVSLTGGVLLTLILSRLAPHLVLMAALTVIGISGILSPGQLLAGFGNPGLITVAAMFVVAAGIQGAGGVDLLVNRLLGRPQTERAALWRIIAPVVALSGFLNNTPVVATLIPAITRWARRIDIAPSKLMIPLSYAAILGGTLTMIGTSTNLVINGQYQVMTGQPGFSLFSITAAGLPVALAGAAFMLLFFPRLLPDRRDHPGFDNPREFTLEVAVTAGGPLVGQTISQAGLRHLRRVFLVEIERDGQLISVVQPDEVLHSGDRLVFAGDTEAITDLLRIPGLQPSADNGQGMQPHQQRQLVEAVVSQHCEGLGQTIRDTDFRERYGAVVLAVARNGERVDGNLGSIRLSPGDTLLLEAGPRFLVRARHIRDFLVINDLGQEAPRHERAGLSWVILGAVVLLAGTGLLDMLYAALIGAAAMLATRCCTLRQAEQSLDLPVLITIAASFALGAALEQTGVAALAATQLVSLSNGHPWLLLALVYATVSLLTEIITNNAAAILMLPIALALSGEAGLAAEPFVFAIMLAASASFATPLGYQTNLMVLGPGNYRFGDFLRVGLPMNVLVGIVSIAVIPWLWPLR